MESDNQGVKEETFIQTSRWAGDRQLGGEDSWQGGGWWTGQSYICVQINWEKQLGSETDHTTQGSSTVKESFTTSGCKNLWGLQQQQEKHPALQKSLLERPTRF